jgi:hypothetical protein
MGVLLSRSVARAVVSFEFFLSLEDAWLVVEARLFKYAIGFCPANFEEEPSSSLR